MVKCQTYFLRDLLVVARQRLQRHYAMNWGQIFMSLMDPTRVDSSILSETMRRTSLRPSHLRQLLNTKSSSLMRQIIQPTTYNSSYGRLLRSLVATVDLSSPATTRTKSLNLFTPGVRSLIFQSLLSKDLPLQQISSKDSNKSLNWSKLSSIQKSLQNSSTSTFQTGEECLTSVRDTLWVVRLTREFLRRLRR